MVARHERVNCRGTGGDRDGRRLGHRRCRQRMLLAGPGGGGGRAGVVVDDIRIPRRARPAFVSHDVDSEGSWKNRC